ncbi:GPCR fungal pheromone mating factor, partial [Mycena rebaudengoi]
MHPELALGSFLASALVLIPLPWHWRAKNIATLSIIAWLFTSNLIYAINSIIWAESIDSTRVPVWCDIVTKLQVGATAALPVSCLSLALQLRRVSCAKLTLQKTRHTIILDMMLCLCFPGIIMVLHYIVQGHRFDIIQDLGCRPALYVSLASIFLFYGPVALVALLTLIVSGFAYVGFHQRRMTFDTFLKNQNSSFTVSRYLRLMIITAVLGVWDTIVVCICLVFTYRNGLLPWTSWADVHWDFSRIDVYPILFIPPEIMTWTYVSWWTVPISGFMFFAFFSFGEDAVAEYGPWFKWV